LQKKQLIWDTYNKLKFSEDPIFHGTGNEIRDFFYISDAIDLIDYLISHNDSLMIVNGGTGIGTTIYDVINKIKNLIKSDKEIVFNQVPRTGDPFSLSASTLLLDKIGFVSKVSLNEGLSKTIFSYESS